MKSSLSVTGICRFSLPRFVIIKMPIREICDAQKRDNEKQCDPSIVRTFGPFIRTKFVQKILGMKNQYLFLNEK